MIRAVGIDASLRASGFARADGTCQTFKPHLTHPARLHELVARIGARLLTERPDVVVIEGYFSNPKFVHVAIQLAELGGALRVMLLEQTIPFVEIQPAALKMYATGNGNANKQQMVDAARTLGAVVDNDNEADAWLLRLIALQRYQPTLDYPQLTESLTLLEWPVLEVAA